MPAVFTARKKPVVAKSGTSYGAAGRCAHCSRKMGTFASGYAKVGNKQVCHPNVQSRPDCYHLVTVYKHEMPCSKTECYPKEDEV